VTTYIAAMRITPRRFSSEKSDMRPVLFGSFFSLRLSRFRGNGGCTSNNHAR
jgi:hypothetical protein